MADVIAAISTGNQLSAIGILRLSGPGCAQVAGQVFQPAGGYPLAEAPNRKLVLGTLRDAVAGYWISAWGCTPGVPVAIPGRIR